MMKRDFTNETRDRLEILVREADENWFDWTDSFGDFFLRCGLSEVIGFFAGTEAHQRALFDQNNTSLADLQRIFDAVYETEGSYANKFKIHIEELQGVHEKLKQITSSTIGRSSYESATSALTDEAIRAAFQDQLARYADYLAQHPKVFSEVMAIAEYESLHPKYVDQANAFFSVLDMEDEIGIKGMIYRQDEPARILCLRYLDRFTITNTAVEGSFSSRNATLAFNVSDDRTNKRGRYYTFFHEAGHAIDWYYGNDQGFGGFYTDSLKIDGNTLTDTIYGDVRANLTVNANILLEGSVYSSLRQDQRDVISSNVVDNLMLQNRNFNNLIPDEQAFEAKLVNEYNNILRGADNNTASDIYGAVTNNTIVGDYSHTKPSYWFDANLNPTQGPNKECFAGYFARIMTDDPQKTDGLDSISTLLPDSKQFMDQMLGGMS